jgi:clan AA aspartic protease (TIGR02281 family)
VEPLVKGLKPEDRIGGPPVIKGWRRPILGLLAIAAIGAGGLTSYQMGVVEWWKRLAAEDALQHATKPGQMVLLPQIGINELPLHVANSPMVRPGLERLKRETCDRVAIQPLAEVLKFQGYPRQAGEALASFFIRCKAELELLDNAVETFMAISDHKRAHELAEMLVKKDPAYARYRYLRGWAAEKLGMFKESLLDHIDALNLLGDPRNVASSMFYEVSQAHARLGQYCEAMTPIQQWVSYDNSRDTAQTRTIIQEYADQGNCKLTYANVPESFSLPVQGDVIKATVFVNGVPGNFIIDTGATFVSISNKFARLAKLQWDSQNLIQVNTANGISTSVLSTADTVSLGPIKAQKVTIGIAPLNDFGEDVDGLLGMSFLARFEVSLTPTQLVIKRAR